MPLIQAEAYLGPDKPETIAEGIFSVPYAGYVPTYGVVRQDRETGETELAGVYVQEQAAMGRLAQVTTHKGFGILTSVRTCIVNPDSMEARGLKSKDLSRVS